MNTVATLRPVTVPQRRVLQILWTAGDKGLSARDVALQLWPESPAWRKRPRTHGYAVGAMGGTMQMSAGRLLHRMRDLGLCYVESDYRWHALVGPTSARLRGGSVQSG